MQNKTAKKLFFCFSKRYTCNTMTTREELERQLKTIQARNTRVEADKAWETSKIRKLVIMILTYFVIVVFFFVATLPHPWINAIIPSIAFLLSTLTVPICKKWWLKKYSHK